MIKKIGLISLTLIAFAANSLLTRLALLDNAIDPASFTAIRLISGAITLAVIYCTFSQGKIVLSRRRHGWGAFFLLVYAVTFSFAYIHLDTATGALILFGTVQLTMIIVSQWRGHTLSRLEWAGFLLALFGFLYLTIPQFTTPSWSSLLLMTLSGIAWAAYTLNGKASTQALMDTTLNFLLAAPVALVIFLLSQFLLNSNTFLSSEGILLAIASGALASGIGYSLWYTILPTMRTSQAATLQLLVPIIAGLGGVLIVNEALSMRLLLAGGIILVGVYLTIIAKKTTTK